MAGEIKILIAGGNGAIGRQLEDFLKKKKFDICLLSRNKSKADGKRVFYWNVEKNEIDERCFDNVSHIIQLSGANISEKRWTAARKQEIINSRVKSTNLLFQSVKNNNVKLQSFISASAVGYYGNTTSINILKESDLPGKDFLAETCILWENVAEQFSSIGIRTVKIRTAVVLMKNGGVLKKLLAPTRYRLLPLFGSGKQYFSWIHINDLCEIYYKAVIDQNFTGAFNAVAPSFITNNYFITALQHAINKPLLKICVPGFVLKIALGELSETLLNGSRISSGKISNTGYKFIFDTPEKALFDLLKS